MPPAIARGQSTYSWLAAKKVHVITVLILAYILFLVFSHTDLSSRHDADVDGSQSPPRASGYAREAARHPIPKKPLNSHVTPRCVALRIGAGKLPKSDPRSDRDDTECKEHVLNAHRYITHRSASLPVNWTVTDDDVMYHVGLPSHYGLPVEADVAHYTRLYLLSSLTRSQHGSVDVATLKTMRLAASLVTSSSALVVELFIRDHTSWPAPLAIKSYLPPSTSSRITPDGLYLTFDRTVIPALTSLAELGYRVYVYDTPTILTTDTYDKDLYLDPMSGRNQYCTDYVVHQNMLHSPLRTKNIAEADLMFVPYYAMAVYRGNVSEKILMSWLRNTSTHYYKRLGLSDFVFALPATHSYFNMRFAGDKALLKPFISIGFEIPSSKIVLPFFSKNIVSPYPSFLRPFGRNDDQRILGSKDIHLAFAGSLSVYTDVRVAWKNAMDAQCPQGRCWFFNIDHFLVGSGQLKLNVTEIVDYYERSIFCFAPAGWSTMAKRTFDVIHSLCIPIISSDDASLPFESFLPWPTFSIRISSQSILANASAVVDEIFSIPKVRIQAYQTALVNARHQLQFHYPKPVEKDAFHMLSIELGRRAFHTRLAKCLRYRFDCPDGHMPPRPDSRRQRLT